MKTKQTRAKQQFTYEIETDENQYSVQVDITFFIKFPDHSTWDSDYDYYGYTEIVDTEIISILLVDENSNETEVEFKKLPEDEQKRIQVILDEFIDKQEPDYD